MSQPEPRSQGVRTPTDDELQIQPPPQDMGTILITDPAGKQRTLILDRTETTFGRGSQNTVALPDPKCSRRHLAILRTGAIYEARDLGSTNGVTVNGQKVRGKRLKDGDVVGLGSHRLTYHGPSAQGADQTVPAAEPTAGEALELLLAEPPTETALRKSPPAPAPVQSDEEETLNEKRPTTDSPLVPVVPAEPEDCPQCHESFPESQTCAKCGTKSLRLQAQEFYVDKVLKTGSVFSQIGLWNLRRPALLQKASALEDVEWVLEGECEKCHAAYREINQFRPRCVRCAKCGAEIALPLDDPPAV